MQEEVEQIKHDSVMFTSISCFNLENKKNGRTIKKIHPEPLYLKNTLQNSFSTEEVLQLKSNSQYGSEGKLFGFKNIQNITVSLVSSVCAKLR